MIFVYYSDIGHGVPRNVYGKIVFPNICRKPLYIILRRYVITQQLYRLLKSVKRPHLRKSRSGLNVRRMLGTGLLNKGTRIVFRTGNPLVGSLSNVPFLKDLIAFIHASLVL